MNDYPEPPPIGTPRRHGQTPAERRTARHLCVQDGCREAPTYRVALVLHAGDYHRTITTPHRVCQAHRRDVRTEDVARANELAGPVACAASDWRCGRERVSIAPATYLIA